MGILQKAVETYDSHKELVGVLREDHAVLAPISHIITRASIEITIDQDGNFISARTVDKSEPKIIIPATEESAGRASGPRAHPLCDVLEYVSSGNDIKHTLYVEGLASWAKSEFSNPKLDAVLAYVNGDTILTDLERSGIITLDENGRFDSKFEKSIVCWNVIGLGDNSGPCYADASLFRSFIDYYHSKQTMDNEVLCMVSGENTVAAIQHQKGIVSVYGNARLISANDSSGFTYRGRFMQDSEAATVGYEASQKAHSALRWLISGQGEYAGGRVFLCWNPHGFKTAPSIGAFMKNVASTVEPSDYREELKRTLSGYKSELPNEEDVVIAAFDAATTGRLSVTYYNELRGSDFLQRLYDWDERCCWWNYVGEIQPPTLFTIINCAYGTERSENRLECDDKLLKQQMQGLLTCRVDKAVFPKEIRKALADRASTPQAFGTNVWRRIVFTACAVINISEYQRNGDDCMSWELDKHDRSYQFGRLLAVMERAEEDYYRETNEDRQTSAIKALSVYRQRPWTVYEQVNRQLCTAYLPRIKPWQRTRYQKLTDEIISIIASFPEEELNRPLSDIYLMGYDRQRNAFFKSTKNNENENNNTEE